ncbi:MAG: twin-arginine translocase subunit TatC [Acidobacteria bacterium]|nr:twin-arginine translocase subunit TatC [Acidobacteriota bacterium]
MSSENDKPRDADSREESPESTPSSEGASSSSAEEPKKATYYDDPYDDYDYEYDDPAASKKEVAKVEPSAQTPAPPPPPTTGLDDEDEDDEDEEGMARMSFLEHLEELRTRIVRSALGLLLAYVVALAAAPQLFTVFSSPFNRAAAPLPYDPPLTLTQITPTEQFYLMYVKIPLLASIFLAAPWLMYQIWSFIAPGLYKRERRWAVPFIFSTATLFILGGLFCYFIALRFALAFLIGLGYDQNVRPMISLESYYDMFFNLHIGLGLVFQMPIVIFFFTLLRITTPGFLMSNGRYAILIIFVIAAVITPTPDVTTMLTFAAPMVLLFYVGIAASYLIVMRREGRSFPWSRLFLALFVLLAIAAGVIALLHFKMGYEFSTSYPWLLPPS